MEPPYRDFILLEDEFRKCKTNQEKVNFFINHKCGKPPLLVSSSGKDDGKAAAFRQKGNQQFTQKMYFEALESYTWSIAWAKSGTVASLAYSNRSALLLKVRLLEECLIDVERALENCPKDLKLKLLSRKQEALQLQQTPEKETLNITTHVEIQQNEEFGNFLTTSRHTEIGDVLLVEKPLAAVLVDDFCIYCHECLALCYTLIPCHKCAEVLYCSDTCKKRASSYHKYECCVLRVPKIHLHLALKITLATEHKNEITKFVTHSEERPLRDLFALAWFTHVVFMTLKEKTALFDDRVSEDFFKDLFLFVLQVIDINSVAINRLEPSLKGYQTVRYGCALYKTFSLFNHSCYPNAFFYHDGPTVVVRALSTIDEGAQCFISYHYTYSTTPKVTRQMELQSKYFFKCTCRACEENWSEEGEANEAFDKPFACVLSAQMQQDHDLLKSIVPTFIRNLKWIEDKAPIEGLTCLRQLVVDCYQIYESPKRFK